MPKFKITTLGCKVNQSESDAIARELVTSNCRPAQARETVDFCIINTCTVTQKASMQSRQAIRQAIRANPDARIVVTGCYAQIDAGEIKRITGVDYIVDQKSKGEIIQLLNRNNGNKCDGPVTVCSSELGDRTWDEPVGVNPGNRTRPFLKIQDGCNSFCTYCIVPYARGRSRSMPLDEVMQNIKLLADTGFQEIVLTGVQLGQYGIDLQPGTSLTQLLNRIALQKPINRIRLSSIEPVELTDDIINIVAQTELFCRHFHIPLQSGDNEVLKQMHRPYSREFFRDLVMKIKTRIPGAAIGADTLIGFPGETAEAFENTYRLIEALPLSYLHVFPFSARPGTPASKFSNHLPPQVIKDRCRQMRELGKHKRHTFYDLHIGQSMNVLIESKRDAKTGLLKGISSNYVPVLVEGDDRWQNKIVNVKFVKRDDQGIYGDIYQN